MATQLAPKILHFFVLTLYCRSLQSTDMNEQMNRPIQIQATRVDGDSRMVLFASLINPQSQLYVSVRVDNGITKLHVSCCNETIIIRDGSEVVISAT